MPDHKLSAREAALIAQVRAELQQKSNVPAAKPAAPQRGNSPAAGAEAAAPTGRMERAAPDPVQPLAPGLDAAERLALLMAAARAESERRRRRQKMLYLWVPFAFMSMTALWTLIWMWQQL